MKLYPGSRSEGIHEPQKLSPFKAGSTTFVVIVSLKYTMPHPLCSLSQWQRRFSPFHKGGGTPCSLRCGKKQTIMVELSPKGK